jgi:hypothetical protein
MTRKTWSVAVVQTVQYDIWNFEAPADEGAAREAAERYFHEHHKLPPTATGTKPTSIYR